MKRYLCELADFGVVLVPLEINIIRFFCLLFFLCANWQFIKFNLTRGKYCKYIDDFLVCLLILIFYFSSLYGLLTFTFCH